MASSKKKHKRRRIPSASKTVVSKTQELYISSLSLGYYPKVDKFYCTLSCFLGRQKLSIHGYLDDIAIVSDGVLIRGYRNSVNSYFYDKTYNCSELSLSSKDYPTLFNIVKSYVNSCGDMLDLGELVTELNYKPTVACVEYRLPSFEELLKNNFTVVYGMSGSSL